MLDTLQKEQARVADLVQKGKIEIETKK